MGNKSKEFEFGGMVLNGFLMLFVQLILLPLLAFCGVWLLEEPINWIVLAIVSLLFLICLGGFMIVEPNEARVIMFFGEYCGTFKRVGYVWINPFMTARKLSYRMRNMDVKPIKVNDKTGNPVMIGMVLVWRIKDTYKAIFDVDSETITTSGTTNYIKALENFVSIQSDAALREVTGHYAYDETKNSDTNEITLRSGGEEINHMLEHKINERLTMAGMEVVEARLNYLAYAPEIAAVMLRRQQAEAIIAAREKIVEGAVSMVKMAIDGLATEGVVKLNEEKKAAMVSNLLVVLCADEPAQPVVSANS